MPDLTPQDFKLHEDEIFKYISQIMSLTPAESITVLASVIAKIIREQGYTPEHIARSVITTANLMVRLTLEL